MPEMSSVFLNTLRLTRRMVHVHLRRLFSAAVGWLSTSDLICSLNPMILYRFSIWLFYCWEYRFDVHITIVWLSIFPLISVNRCLIYWSAPSFGWQTFTMFYFLDELICLWLWYGLLCLLLHVWLTVYFVWDDYSYSYVLFHFPGLSFPSLLFRPMCDQWKLIFLYYIVLWDSSRLSTLECWGEVIGGSTLWGSATKVGA